MNDCVCQLYSTRMDSLLNCNLGNHRRTSKRTLRDLLLLQTEIAGFRRFLSAISDKPADNWIEPLDFRKVTISTFSRAHALPSNRTTLSNRPPRANHVTSTLHERYATTTTTTSTTASCGQHHKNDRSEPHPRRSHLCQHSLRLLAFVCLASIHPTLSARVSS